MGNLVLAGNLFRSFRFGAKLFNRSILAAISIFTISIVPQLEPVRQTCQQASQEDIDPEASLLTSVLACETHVS